MIFVYVYIVQEYEHGLSAIDDEQQIRSNHIPISIVARYEMLLIKWWLQHKIFQK